MHGVCFHSPTVDGLFVASFMLFALLSSIPRTVGYDPGSLSSQLEHALRSNGVKQRILPAKGVRGQPPKRDTIVRRRAPKGADPSKAKTGNDVKATESKGSEFNGAHFECSIEDGGWKATNWARIGTDEAKQKYNIPLPNNVDSKYIAYVNEGSKDASLEKVIAKWGYRCFNVGFAIFKSGTNSDLLLFVGGAQRFSYKNNVAKSLTTTPWKYFYVNVDVSSYKEDFKVYIGAIRDGNYQDAIALDDISFFGSNDTDCSKATSGKKPVYAPKAYCTQQSK